MAALDVTVKFAASLQANASSGTGSRYPDSVDLSFTAQKRLENQVRHIASSGNLTIVKADEGFDTVHLLKIECLTPGKGFNATFNGDSNGSDVLPPDTTSKAFLIATTDFTEVALTNLDDASPISIQFSLYQKKS